MDWLFDNLGKSIPLIVGLFYFISSLKKGGEKEAEQSPEAQERARKIQEEIRRKILERQGGGSVSNERSSTEVAEPDPHIEFLDEEVDYNPMIPEVSREVISSEPVFVPEYVGPSQSELLEEQRLEMERKLSEAREFKRKLALRKAEEERSVTSNNEYSARRSNPGTSLRSSLKGRQSLRDAIILKEILGEPVALRGN